MVRAVVSSSAAARLTAASRFLTRFPPGSEVLVVGASRGAADDFVRQLARHQGATFGLTRFSLTELAARTVATSIATARTPGTQGATEALTSRAVFEATAAGELSYFEPVASLPGFPRALARTLHELRLAGVTPGELVARGAAGADIGRLLERFESQMADARIDDRAALFTEAAALWSQSVSTSRAHPVRWRGMPVVMIDATLDSAAEQQFGAAVLESAAEALVTICDGDGRARQAIEALGIQLEQLEDDAAATTDLWHLRRYLFGDDRPARRARSGDVRLFSAPGEGREMVEIVRRMLDEAAAGVPFDEMAVFLRAPQQYLGLLEHACARASIPVHFDRGTRRPDPAGRAFVALLSCAAEYLSAKRFDEYLSLAQVPRVAPAGGEAQAIRSRDDLFAPLDEAGESPESVVPELSGDSDEEAIVAGTLRAPWKWEELIVESAVVGGRTRAEGGERWRRRLAGLAAEYELRIRELRSEEPDSARIARYQRDLRNLRHLRDFALPIVDSLAAWPDEGTWGEWLARFEALASSALAKPTRVLQTLADLRPMAAVGPVSIAEACDVLRERLIALDWDPPPRRYGHVFVGTPHQARGRTFRVVFVPGLAERIVPQRPREDPLLLDTIRRDVAPRRLVQQDDRGQAERLLLKLSIGAATERLYLSYPRMDVAQTRARVPSFYALDVMRAITGGIPDHRVLATEAAGEGGASLAWPAPADPDHAIDDLEHDLAVLRPLLEERDPAAVRGRAHYLLALNEALRRSVISRWSRGRKAWSPSDGLVAVTPRIEKAIAANRLAARPFSLSALQRFSACPYQFLLATVHRLEPW